MPLPSFAFTGQAGQQADPAGMQQYIQQGQASINPGQAAVAASNPVGMAGAADLAKALASIKSNPTAPPQIQPGVAQAAMGAGAAMNPNSPSGENMGGVGPTQNNLALAQGLQNAMGNTSQQNGIQQFLQPQQPAMQNYQNGVSGGGWFGGSGG